MSSHDQCLASKAVTGIPVMRQAGLTLVELMISITVGLFVVMAATALLLSTRSGYAMQDDSGRMLDTGRYALEVISRAVRQAAYENWDSETAPILAAASISANIAGLDGHSLKSGAPDIDMPVKDAVNGSDVLALRFFGAGGGTHGDGAIIDCAGFGIPAANSVDDAEDERGWSIFYVGKDSSGEPELYCKYRSGNGSWTSQAIARGVESFQVLYGVDTDADGLPNVFLNASAIDRLDDALVLEGVNAAARALDRNRKTHWKKVTVVKVALLVRGSQGASAGAASAEHHLFGKAYSDAYANTDAGTHIQEAALPKAVRNRLRKLFVATVQMRNQAAESAP